jgi:hypothetical protein
MKIFVFIGYENSAFSAGAEYPFAPALDLSDKRRGGMSACLRTSRPPITVDEQVYFVISNRRHFGAVVISRPHKRSSLLE